MAFINRLNSRHKIQLQWMCILFACPASIFSFSLKRVPRFCFGKHPSPHSSYKALAGLTPLSGFSFGQVTETWSMRVHNWEQFKGSIHDRSCNQSEVIFVVRIRSNILSSSLNSQAKIGNYTIHFWNKINHQEACVSETDNPPQIFKLVFDIKTFHMTTYLLRLFFSSFVSVNK